MLRSTSCWPPFAIAVHASRTCPWARARSCKHTQRRGSSSSGTLQGCAHTRPAFHGTTRAGNDCVAGWESTGTRSTTRRASRSSRWVIAIPAGPAAATCRRDANAPSYGSTACSPTCRLSSSPCSSANMRSAISCAAGAGPPSRRPRGHSGTMGPNISPCRILRRATSRGACVTLGSIASSCPPCARGSPRSRCERRSRESGATMTHCRPGNL